MESSSAPTPQAIQAMDQLLATLDGLSGRRIAIFLGAGASKTFGYPLTRELMSDIFAALESGRVLNRVSDGPGGGTVTSGQALREFLGQLLPSERRSRDMVPMVTGVLSLLDFSLATGQTLLPGKTLEETRRMRRLLERALLAVIPDDAWWDQTDPGERRQEEYFNEAGAWLGRLVEHSPGNVSLITTNYDMASDVLAIDVADPAGRGQQRQFTDVARLVDFGFRWTNPGASQEEHFGRPADPAVTLLKLHGSSNWLRCPLCENIYIHPNYPISQLVEQDINTPVDGPPEGATQCHCSPTGLEPQIVSPSFVREMREPNLIAIWKAALETLREADHWLMIGYSFPDEDVAIRALITRAYSSSKHRESLKVSVVQLGDGSRVNYESFFPPGTVGFYTGGFGLLLDRHRAGRQKKAPPGKPRKARSARSG